MNKDISQHMHFVAYSKNWYPIGDIEADLKIIANHWSGYDACTVYDVVSILSRFVFPYMRPNDLESMVIESIKEKSHKPILERLIGILMFLDKNDMGVGDEESFESFIDRELFETLFKLNGGKSWNERVEARSQSKSKLEYPHK